MAAETSEQAALPPALPPDALVIYELQTWGKRGRRGESVCVCEGEEGGERGERLRMEREKWEGERENICLVVLMLPSGCWELFQRLLSYLANEMLFVCV